jgi:uncharacterized membrane-anchored protein
MKFKIAAVWIALQVLFFVLWAQTEERRFAEGEGDTILVETMPVDPRDLLRGQYMQLAYTFTRPGQFDIDMADIPVGAGVWVIVGPNGKFHEPVGAYTRKPETLAPDEVALRGRWDGWQVDCGVGRFYVEEGTPTPTGGPVTVRLRVAENGSVRIEQIYVNGRKWP